MLSWIELAFSEGSIDILQKNLFESKHAKFMPILIIFSFY